MAIAVRDVTTGGPVPVSSTGRVPDSLAALLPVLCDALRRSALPAGTRLGAMSSYHLGWVDAQGRPRDDNGGKYLRGCLALWASQRCGGTPDDALAVATAVEWIHNFTLVHDDIQDGDTERRHRPTVWSVWGRSQAINAGDGMHAAAYRALLSDGGRPGTRLRAAAALNEAVLEVIEGQCLDLDLEGRVDTTVASYLRLARAKTGALIGAALQAGALMGGATVARASLLHRAGVELGIAFQVRDDWLGTWGDSAVTGKGRGDIARRKVTYPLTVARASLHGVDRSRLRALYQRSSGGEDAILGLLEAAGAREAVAGELRRRGDAAMQLVRRSGLAADAMVEFGTIVDFVAGRAA